MGVKTNRSTLIKFIGYRLLRIGLAWLILWGSRPIAESIPPHFRPDFLKWYFTLPNPPFLFSTPFALTTDLWPFLVSLSLFSAGGGLLIWRASKNKKHPTL